MNSVRRLLLLAAAAVVCIAGGLFLLNMRGIQHYLACRKLVVTDVSEEHLPTNLRVGAFYSERLHTCVETRIDSGDTGSFSYLMRDVGHGFIAEDNLTFLKMRAPTDAGTLYAETVENLFFCDRDGVDNVVLTKVQEHRGMVWDLSYPEYMDDEHGGPSRAIHTPNHIYSNDECRREYELKRAEVR